MSGRPKMTNKELNEELNYLRNLPLSNNLSEPLPPPVDPLSLPKVPNWPVHILPEVPTGPVQVAQIPDDKLSEWKFSFNLFKNAYETLLKSYNDIRKTQQFIAPLINTCKEISSRKLLFLLLILTFISNLKIIITQITDLKIFDKINYLKDYPLSEDLRGDFRYYDDATVNINIIMNDNNNTEQLINKKVKEEVQIVQTLEGENIKDKILTIRKKYADSINYSWNHKNNLIYQLPILINNVTGKNINIIDCTTYPKSIDNINILPELPPPIGGKRKSKRLSRRKSKRLSRRKSKRLSRRKILN